MQVENWASRIKYFTVIDSSSQVVHSEKQDNIYPREETTECNLLLEQFSPDSDLFALYFKIIFLKAEQH